MAIYVNRYKWLFAIATSITLLTGCASTGDNSPSDERDSARKAAELNTQLGREYMSRGQYEIALEKLNKAVRSDDDYAPGHTMLAVLYERLGETEDAQKHYRDAVDASPENGDVNNNYGAFLCRTGQGERSFPYFTTALDDPFYRTPEVALTNAGSCAMELSDWDKADEMLREALRYDPEFPDALLALSRLNYEQQDTLRARAFLQRYESRGVMSAESLMLGYQIESSMNNPQGSRKYLDELIEKFPSAAETRELQGRPQR